MDKNCGFCLPCFLFVQNCSRGNDPGILVKSPLLDFKHGLEILEKHKNKKYHIIAMVQAEEFTKVMKGEQRSIS